MGLFDHLDPDPPDGRTSDGYPDWYVLAGEPGFPDPESDEDEE